MLMHCLVLQAEMIAQIMKDPLRSVRNLYVEPSVVMAGGRAARLAGWLAAFCCRSDTW
jgi:hypothetical protein